MHWSSKRLLRETVRQWVGFSHASGDAKDIFELFSKLETEAGLKIEMRALFRQGILWWSRQSSSPRRGPKLSLPYLPWEPLPWRKWLGLRPSKLLNLLLPFPLKRARRNINLTASDPNLVFFFLLLVLTILSFELIHLFVQLGPSATTKPASTSKESQTSVEVQQRSHC